MPTVGAELGQPRDQRERDDAPTTAILAIALRVSKTIRGPNRFLTPETGLIRLKSGLSAVRRRLEADLADVREHAGGEADAGDRRRRRARSVVQRRVQQRVEAGAAS